MYHGADLCHSVAVVVLCCWVGLGWVGLGWVGLGWVGLGWVGLCIFAFWEVLSACLDLTNRLAPPALLSFQ